MALRAAPGALTWEDQGPHRPESRRAAARRSDPVAGAIPRVRRRGGAAASSGPLLRIASWFGQPGQSVDQPEFHDPRHPLREGLRFEDRLAIHDPRLVQQQEGRIGQIAGAVVLPDPARQPADQRV